MEATVTFNQAKSTTKASPSKPLTPSASFSKTAFLASMALLTFSAMFALLAFGLVDLDSITFFIQGSSSRLQGYSLALQAFLSSTSLVESLITGSLFLVVSISTGLYRLWAGLPAEPDYSERTGSLPDFDVAEF